MKELKLEEEEQRRKDLLEGKLFWGGKMWIDDDPTELLDPNAMGGCCPPKVVDTPPLCRHRLDHMGDTTAFQQEYAYR